MRDGIPVLREEYDPLFIIVNGENSAGGVGITPDIADEIFDRGIDAITLGNHTFNKRDILPYLNLGRPIVRPANLPDTTPGKGIIQLRKDGIELAVINLCGRVFLDGYDDPFREVDRLIKGLTTNHILIDMHAEATSEKIAIAWHLDGKVSAVVGTHTHVQTADERILPHGTAAVTDVGMTGPQNGVLGMNRDIIVKKFLTSMPARFDVADGPGVICGVSIDVERSSGRSTAIRRIVYEP